MIKPYFSNLLNKSTESSSENSTAKKSYAYGLFKRNFWYPQAIGISPIAEESAPVISQLDQAVKLGDKFEIKKIHSSIGALNRLDSKLSELNDQSVIHSRSVHSKLIESHNLSDIALASEKKVAQDKQQKAQAFSSKEFSLYDSFEDYLKSLNTEWKVDEIPGISSFDNRVDVVFLGLSEIENKELQNMPLAPFSLVKSDQDLLGKMINSITLDQGRFLRCPTIGGHQALEHALNVIKYFKPKIVVTLGAAATNIFFENRIRLSNVHGDIQVKNFKLQNLNETLSVNVFPLFHPDLLEINVSMKKTAWIDLQRLKSIIESGDHN